MPCWFWIALGCLLVLLAACLMSGRAHAQFVLPTKAEAAARIRKANYPCPRITNWSMHSANVARVVCGRFAYRVTIAPLTLRPW